MILSRRLSKLVLTIHIAFSVGWLGAVAVFFALAITGLNSQSSELARACLLAMKISAWFVIVPFCVAAFATGVLQAACTKWGLFRYYWILVKLFLTLGSTILLLLHLQPIDTLANSALAPTFSTPDKTPRIMDLVAKSGAAILVLLFITTVSLYKPWGKIGMKRGIFKAYIIIGLICLALLLLVIKHLFSGGMHGH